MIPHRPAQVARSLGHQTISLSASAYGHSEAHSRVASPPSCLLAEFLVLPPLVLPQRTHTASSALLVSCPARLPPGGPAPRPGNRGWPDSKGRQLTNVPASAGRAENIVPLEEPGALDEGLLQEEESEAEAGAAKDRPGFTMITDGSQLARRAAGCSVAWKRGQSRVGIKTQ